MKIKCSVICLISSIFISISTNSNYKCSKTIENKNITFSIKNDETIELSSLEDQSGEVFQNALNEYDYVYSSYIDVLSINVEDKSLINLSEYNPNYIVPTCYKVMLERQNNYESSLDMLTRANYESLKKSDEGFDKYVALNANEYTNLNPITTYHGVSTINLASISSGLSLILSGAGLSAKLIAAFEASLETLKLGLKILTISAFGKALAAGIVAGALIAITTIIVTNRNKIAKIFEDIKNYFLEEFVNIKYKIINFFKDINNKINDSLKTKIEIIAGMSLEFLLVQSWDLPTQKEMVDSCKNNEKYVKLMQRVKEDSFQMIKGLVTVDFCISNKTHKAGYSSYVWQKQTAKELILKAGTGFVYEDGCNKLFNAEKTLYFFKHFHNGDIDNDEIIRHNGKDEHRSHSFYGPILYIPSIDAEPVEVE